MSWQISVWILEERLKRALAGLGLVRRVGGVELAAAGDGIDHGRDEVVVGPAAEEADGVVRRAGSSRQVAAMCRGQFHLGRAGGISSGRPSRRSGRDVGEQILDRRDPDCGQHGLLVGGRVQDVRHEMLSDQWPSDASCSSYSLAVRR